MKGVENIRMSQCKNHTYCIGYQQGFSYHSEIRTRDLLNLGKKHLDHQNWEELILDCHFK